MTPNEEVDDVHRLEMAQLLSLECMTTSDRHRERTGCIESKGANDHARPVITRSHSDPIPLRTTGPGMEVATDDIAKGQSHRVVDDAIPQVLQHALYTHLSGEQCSGSTIGDLPLQLELPFPKSSLTASATSPDLCTSDDYRTSTEHHRATTRGRLGSSISMGASTLENISKAAVRPSDFRLPPEHPEKRFVDDVGIIFPRVCDRQQCAHSQMHFVTSFRLCEPTEYTTSLADHGITYADYCRLITALWDFLDKTEEAKKRRKGNAEPVAARSAEAVERNGLRTKNAPCTMRSFWDTTEQLKKNNREAVELNKLLEEITWNLQARGVSVVVCVHSFSLFATSRISEAHIQILHVSHDQTLQTALASAPPGTPSQRMGQRLSFIDVFSFAGSEPRPMLERQAMSATETTKCVGNSVCDHTQNRDSSKPHALWPNAIPLRKRQILNANIDRYGFDPYFRAWMRANINSRTRCSTYAKYLVETEQNPLVNRRKRYADTTLNQDIVAALMRDDRAWNEQFPSTINRAKYEHNRRLECRKTTEQGSRLRIMRFGFRHPIYPPHTPEMEVLGLSKHAYQAILANFDRMHTSMRLNTRCPGMYVVASLNKVRRKGTEDALMKARSYIKRLNASQRELVWTIEKIPWVYDKGFGRNRAEWEISAWNAKDPLELLMQLERWGIIENRMTLDDED
jgi:hypothetical protein